MQRLEVARDARPAWPSPRWRRDILGFARDVLGIRLWSRQAEILKAIQASTEPDAKVRRTAVASGHKIGKSTTAAVAALWFFCSFDDSRTVLTAPTSRQVDAILWREVKRLHSRSLLPIDGEPAELARTGLHSGLREIVGFTARESEAVAGVSAPHLLYLPDEASGIPNAIFEAIEGNRAGGAVLAMFSNPTRTEGEFFDAFASKSEFYTTIRVSSEESPNVTGEDSVPGLATADWIEEKRREWGEESPLFRVRVKGEFVKNETGKVVSLHTIEIAERRWDDTAADGRLCIGVDPAGPGEEGDEWAFAARRGLRHLAISATHGLTPQAGLVRLLGIIIEWRKPREPKPLVVVDGLGKSGAEFVGTCRAYLADNPDSFDLCVVRGSDRAVREPLVYDHVRDELWANLARWLGEGGAILEDAKLAQELHAPAWVGQLSGRLRATEKKILRKELGRSPDRGDALTLAVWEPMNVSAVADDAPTPPTADEFVDEHYGDTGAVFDPYGGAG